MRLNIIASLLLILMILFASLLPVMASDIFEAIKKGDIENVKAMIEKEAGIVNERGKGMFTGETPLCLAASGGHIFDAIESGDIRMVKELFNADPNIINTENAGGETPFFYGVRHGKKEIVEFFLSKGADIDVKKNNLTVLQLAAKLS